MFSKCENDNDYPRKFIFDSYLGGSTTAFVPCIYAIENGDQLYIPMISYLENIYYDSGDLMASQGIGNHNNEFNTSCLNSLSLMPLTDTILYQNNKVIYIAD